MITWEINNYCNFQCQYCWQWHNRSPLKAIDTEILSASIKKLTSEFLFLLTGGEPFLESNFIEICRTLTENHYIAINTNLSLPNVFDFGKTINPRKCLFINAAVHIAERKKRDPNLEDYLEKIRFLQEKNFNVISCYIAHPMFFDRIEEDFAFLTKNGAKKVRLKVFRGKYRGKLFPESFIEEEKDFIENFLTDFPELEILNKSHSYIGQLCRAGQRFFVMNRNGDLKRCSSLYKSYGNLFNNEIRYDKMIKPCPITKCHCPYEGIRNVLSNRGSVVAITKELLSEKVARSLKLANDPNIGKKIKRKLVEFIR